MARSVTRRSISFEEQDIRTVNRVAKMVGGFSAALRLIIRQWAEHQNALEAETAEQRVRITELGKSALRDDDAIDLG